MKVLLVNGSPHRDGCTFTSLSEVAGALNKNGVESEIFWIGNRAIQGCISCWKCHEEGADGCVFREKLYTDFVTKMKESDALIIGAPVYYAGPPGALCTILDRVFFSASEYFQFKPAACVVNCRRGGASATFDRLNKYFTILQMLDHFFIFQKNSLHLKLANFSSLKRRSIFTSRKILREKLELHSASKKSLNIAKMVEKRFDLPVSTHDLAYEKIRLANCHPPYFSDKSENPHARVTGVHKFLTLTPPLVLVDNHGADHQEMKPL